jgi:N6-L-threonylcarbamoyladenine synthase
MEEHLKAIVVGGGVSANSRLRERLNSEAKVYGFDLFIPPLWLTTDNAAMIACLGYSMFREGKRSHFSATKIGGPAANFGGDMVADPSLTIGDGNGTFK